MAMSAAGGQHHLGEGQRGQLRKTEGEGQMHLKQLQQSWQELTCQSPYSNLVLGELFSETLKQVKS